MGLVVTYLCSDFSGHLLKSSLFWYKWSCLLASGRLLISSKMGLVVTYLCSDFSGRLLILPFLVQVVVLIS